MGLLSGIAKLFSAEKTDKKQETPSSTQTVKENNISVFNSEQTSTAEDVVEFKNRSADDIPNENKLSKRDIRKKHNISFFKNIVYEIKDLFVDQDLRSKLEKKYEIEGEDKESYEKAVSEYFEEQLGDLSGLSEEEIQKRYDKVKEEFYLQMLHLPEDDISRALISEALGSLEATDRTEAAKDFIGLADTEREVNMRARCLARDAKYNMTAKDAFGNVPEDAEEYHFLTFSNMDEEGILEAIDNLNNELANIDVNECKRLQALKEQGEKLTAEQEELLTIYNNYVIKGHAGGFPGIASNKFVNSNTSKELMQMLYNQALRAEIENDVFKVIPNILKNHPELAELINDKFGCDFKSLMDEVTDNNYSAALASAGGTKGFGILKAVGKNKGRYDYAEGFSGSRNSDVTVTVKNATRNKNLNDKNVGHSMSSTGDKTVTPDEKYTNEQYADDGISLTTTVETDNSKALNGEQAVHISSKDNEPKTLESALTSVSEYTDYIKKNNISILKACVTALNSRHANTYIKDLAKKQFKTFDKSEKMIVYACLNSSAQMEVTSVMDENELLAIKTFNSVDTKKYVEKRIEEHKEQEKLKHRDSYTEIYNVA